MSGTDLAHHVACRHLTALELAAAQRISPPERNGTAGLAAAARRGPRAGLCRLPPAAAAAHRRSAPIAGSMPAAFARRGRRRGAGVVLQAPLGDEHCVGAPTSCGASTSEARSAHGPATRRLKLARETRGSAILELCAYAEMLAALLETRTCQVRQKSICSRCHAYSLLIRFPGQTTKRSCCSRRVPM